jgi:hypothetical protein
VQCTVNTSDANTTAYCNYFAATHIVTRSSTTRRMTMCSNTYVLIVSVNKVIEPLPECLLYRVRSSICRQLFQPVLHFTLLKDVVSSYYTVMQCTATVVKVIT